ncbi:MAG: hypothetical protein LBE20_04925, partial [Deltaproteobacteria bacterium]|nr:hypothetical protein [Deltaproteobacteria bacterium]
MSERISSQTRNKNQKQTQSKDKEIKQKATIAEAAQTRAAQHANQEKLVFIGKDNKVINVDANTKILNRVGNKNEFSLVYGRNNNLYYDKPVNLLVDGELVEAKYKGREKISSNTDITTQAAQHANQEGLVFIDKDNKVINVDANTKILMIVGNKHEFSSLYGRDNSFYDKTLSNSKRPPVKLLVNGEFVEARYKGKMAILPQSSNTQESQSNISQQGGITPVVTGVQNQTDQKINIDATNKEDIKPTSQEVLSRENFHLEKFTRPARIFSRVLSVGVEISVPDGYTVSYKNGDYVLSEDKTKETAAQKILSQEKKGYHLENVNGRVVEVENGSVYCYEKTTVRGREIPVKCKIESRKTESPTKVRPQQNIESRKTESSTKVRPQQNVEHEKLLFKDKDNNLIVSNPDTQIEIKYNGRRKFSSLKGVKLQEGDPVTLKIDNKKVIVTYQGKAKENQLYNILGANIEQFREDNTPEENASLTEGIKSGMRQLSS